MGERVAPSEMAAHAAAHEHEAFEAEGVGDLVQNGNHGARVRVGAGNGSGQAMARQIEAHQAIAVSEGRDPRLECVERCTVIVQEHERRSIAIALVAQMQGQSVAHLQKGRRVRKHEACVARFDVGEGKIAAQIERGCSAG